jgi:hypothetical protein
MASCLPARPVGEKTHASHVAARPRNAVDEMCPDRIAADCEDDGDRSGCRLGGQHRRRAATGEDHGNAALDQFAGKAGQPLRTLAGPPVFDIDVAAFDKAGFRQTHAERRQQPRKLLGARAPKHADHRPAALRGSAAGPARRSAGGQRKNIPASDHGFALCIIGDACERRQTARRQMRAASRTGRIVADCPHAGAPSRKTQRLAWWRGADPWGEHAPL